MMTLEDNLPKKGNEMDQGQSLVVHQQVAIKWLELCPFTGASHSRAVP